MIGAAKHIKDSPEEHEINDCPALPHNLVMIPPVLRGDYTQGKGCSTHFNRKDKTTWTRFYPRFSILCVKLGESMLKKTKKDCHNAKNQPSNYYIGVYIEKKQQKQFRSVS